MKVSIIVPIYKIEIYLPQCIESICSQSYKNIEIILVNDGSPDRSPIICEEYAKKDDRIIVFHKVNGGLVSARKAGLGIATGDYICHVDGDDWLNPRYVESFVSVIKKYQPDIICSGEITSYPNKYIENKLPERDGFYTKADINKEIVPSLLEREDGYYFNHSIIQKCIKRDIAIECERLVDDKISMSEDHAFIVPAILRANSLYIINECLYYYRMNPSSMTKAKKSLPWIYPELMCNHFVEKVGIEGLEEQFYRAMSHILFNTTISRFINNKSYRNICREIDSYLKQYDSILVRAKYKVLTRRMAVYALRYRWYFLLKLYALKRYR